MDATLITYRPRRREQPELRSVRHRATIAGDSRRGIPDAQTDSGELHGVAMSYRPCRGEASSYSAVRSTSRD